MHDNVTYGLCDWSLCLIFKQWNDELAWKGLDSPQQMTLRSKYVKKLPLVCPVF